MLNYQRVPSCKLTSSCGKATIFFAVSEQENYGLSHILLEQEKPVADRLSSLYDHLQYIG